MILRYHLHLVKRTNTDNDGDGVWESEYGELYKLENDKWKVSFDNGNTWEEL